MKKLSIIFLLFAFTFSNAQVITYDEISSATKKLKVNDIQEYIAKNGESFKIGDSIKIQSPSDASNYFLHIIETDGWATAQKAGIDARGWKTEIIKFKLGGTKRAGFKLFAVGKTSTGVYRYWIGIEDALEYGEIGTSLMTREEAIAKLKESKDLLDLEMMTQEEYDKIKEELSPIIKNN